LVTKFGGGKGEEREEEEEKGSGYLAAYIRAI